MSKELVSQIMKLTCDACGLAKEWNLVGATEAMVIEMQEWYSVERKVIIDGRMTQVIVHACSLPCVPAAAVKLALPKAQNEPTDNIDLASLRAN